MLTLLGAELASMTIYRLISLVVVLAFRRDLT